MPYRVKQDGATLKEKVGVRSSARNRTKKVDLVRGAVYAEGDYIADDKLAGVHLDALEDGNDPIHELLEEVSQSEYDENANKDEALLAEYYQAEGGGPLDEPQKIRTALTNVDLDGPKAVVVENATAEGDESASLAEQPEGADSNELGVEGGGEVDEPQKDQQAYTGQDLDNPEKEAVVEKAGKTKTKAKK